MQAASAAPMSDFALFPIIQATSTSKHSNASPMERGWGFSYPVHADEYT
ncbi:MAG: hypothetical protein ACXVJQ_13590 [Acidimicrobiia bacterium]